MNHSKKGFTLIELLVVISIIALLLSILMPSLSRAKEMARNIVCRSNLRQFGTVVHLYANDNDDKLPIIHVDAKMPANWHPESSMWCVQFCKYLGIKWEDQMEVNLADGQIVGYGKNYADIWRCPSDDEKDEKYVGYGPNYPNVIAYQSNYAGNPVASREPHRLSQAKNPESSLFLTETLTSAVAVYAFYTPEAYGRDHLPGYDSDDDGIPDTAGALGILYNNIGFRHGSDKLSCNAAMLDGHSESWHIKDLLDNKYDVWGLRLF